MPFIDVEVVGNIGFIVGRNAIRNCDGHDGLNFEDVESREHGKRVLEVAAAGSHNMVMLQGILNFAQ